MMALGIFAGLAILISLAAGGRSKPADLPDVPSIKPAPLPPPAPANEVPPAPVETKMSIATVATPQGTITVPVQTDTKIIDTPAGPVKTETKTVLTPKGDVKLPPKISPATQEEIAKSVLAPAAETVLAILNPEGPISQTVKNAIAPTVKKAPQVSQKRWYQVNATRAILSANMSSLPKYATADFQKPPRWNGLADRLIVLSYDKANKPKFTGFKTLPEANAEFTKRVVSGAYPFVWFVVLPKDGQRNLVTITEFVA